MSEYADLRARIEGREVIILDGAIGTRLQRMEVPMSHDAWAELEYIRPLRDALPDRLPG